MFSNGMYYFDIHCHILNGIDDGARNPEVTAQMLKMAYDDGIRGIICTPHYQPGTFDTGKAERVIRVKHLREIAQKFFPDLRIYEGCECFAASGSIVDDIDRGLSGTLADSRYFLAEFSPYTPGKIIERRLMDILAAGYWPIVAHAERYFAFEEEAFRSHIASFCYIQMNADSIMGEDGPKIRKLARKMLSEKIVSFVATDAHGAHHRIPKLSECADYISSNFGEEYAETVLCRNPESIIQNVKI